ncbi:sugar isomerase domain-containing protein [Amnibacterium setariae]|uniref:Sugar isomerase domain-containing protein n=1 Tax=Amnibacterium setariae TaxID=2306585 RepID=A0A3A1TVF1_9MICO|nr:SIS domain-containing protein [Amnibacterium setariae]RIX27800.1 sugar isomerase domain-containing protein [Amnibacterium setariae]
MSDTATSTAVHDFAEAVRVRLAALEEQAASGAFDAAIDLITDAIRKGGVAYAFGTGHSEAFAMEIAGRAGGLIPTKKVALRDLALRGDLAVADLKGANLERDPSVADRLFEIAEVGPHDVVLIASNSGVNGSIIGFALAAKRAGNPVVAVTSFDHTGKVEPKHPSGQRLKDIADIAIDNLAPYGDAAITVGADVPVGAVSSITAAFIAQVLTVGVAERFVAAGDTAPLYLSANIPGGDEHNVALEERYGITRFA